MNSTTPTATRLTRAVSLAATGVLAVSLAGSLAACDSDSSSSGGSGDAATSAEAAEGDGEAVEEEVVVEEEEEEAAPEPDGTRKNPFPAGSVATLGAGGGEVQVQIGEITWDANQIIADENQFNDPAPEGSTYVIIPITVTNVDVEDGITPWLDLSIEYVTPDGNTLEKAMVVGPDALSDVRELFDGASGTGNLVYLMTPEQQGGVMSFEETFSFTSKAVWLATS